MCSASKRIQSHNDCTQDNPLSVVNQFLGDTTKSIAEEKLKLIEEKSISNLRKTQNYASQTTELTSKKTRVRQQNNSSSCCCNNNNNTININVNDCYTKCVGISSLPCVFGCCGLCMKMWLTRMNV